MDLGCPVGQSRLHVHDCRQFRDIKLDRLSGIAGLFQRIGHNRSNDLAHMAHLALGDNRMGRFLHGLAMLVGDLPTAGQPADTLKVSAGKDLDHARHTRRRVGVDRVDRSVGDVRAQEIDMRLTRDVDVIRVISGPGQEPYVFAPL